MNVGLLYLSECCRFADLKARGSGFVQNGFIACSHVICLDYWQAIIIDLPEYKARERLCSETLLALHYISVR